jgi:hypothetical protein
MNVVDHEWATAKKIFATNISGPAPANPTIDASATRHAEPHSAENIQNESQIAEWTQFASDARSVGTADVVAMVP